MDLVYSKTGRGPHSLSDADLEKLPNEFAVVDWETQIPVVRYGNDKAMIRLRKSGKTIHRFASTRLDLISQMGIEPIGGDSDTLLAVLEDTVPIEWSPEFLGFPDVGTPYEVWVERDRVRATGYQKVLMSSPVWRQLITDHLANLKGYDGIIFSPPKPAQYGKPHYPTYVGGSRAPKIIWQHVKESAVEWWEAVCSLFWSLRRKTNLPIIFDCYCQGTAPFRYSKQITEVPDAIRKSQVTFYESLDAMISASEGLIINPIVDGYKGTVEQREDDNGKFNVPQWFQYRNKQTVKRWDI